MNTYRLITDPGEHVVYRHPTRQGCLDWIKKNKWKLKQLDLEVIVEEVDGDDNVVQWWQMYDADIEKGWNE